MINLGWKNKHWLTWLCQLILWASLTSHSTSASTCGGLLTGTGSGQVMSPNYPNKYSSNLVCKWTINSKFGSGIELTVRHLNNKEFTGTKENCYDTLDIYRRFSPTNRSRIGKPLCGSSVAELSSPVIEAQASSSGTTTVQIEFRSDESGGQTGFVIDYKVLCNVQANASEGAVLSPNFPEMYPKDATCVTRVHTPIGTKATLQFDEFDLETSDQCQKDYVEVEYQDANNMRAIKRFCGKTLPSTVVSFSNEIIITFKSDSDIGAKGFRAVWSTGPINQPTDEVTSAVMTSRSALLVTTSSYQETQSAAILNLGNNERSTSEQAFKTEYYVIICCVALVAMAIIVLLLVLRSRKNKRLHFPVNDEEVIFNNHPEEATGARDMCRPRDNTYVEIPLLPGNSGGKSHQTLTQSRRSTTDSIDSVAAAKLDAILEDNKTQHSSPSFSLQNRESTSDSGVYAMADYQPITVTGESPEAIPENPYYFIDPADEVLEKSNSNEESWYAAPTSPPALKDPASLYDRPTSIKGIIPPDESENLTTEASYTSMGASDLEEESKQQSNRSTNQSNNKFVYEQMQPQWD